MFFANDVIKVANSGVGSGVDFDINGKVRLPRTLIAIVLNAA